MEPDPASAPGVDSEEGVGLDPAGTPAAGADPMQSAPPPPPPAVSSLSVNIGDRGSTRAHVPACGNQPTITFTAGPAGAAPVSWAVKDGTATADPGTTLTSPVPPAGARNPAASTLRADLVPSAAQGAGTVKIEATNTSGGMSTDYLLASHPTSIDSTRVVGNPTSSADYGGVFDHVFARASGGPEAIEGVAVGERFPNLPNPTAATHTFATPFGQFTLTTGTLPDAASGASGNWFLTSAGELGGTHDNVTIAKSMVDIGQHLVSDSNPNPTNPLPAGFTIDQNFHWWCPHGAAGSRWTQFTPTTHRRELRLDGSGGAEFVAIVNGQENAMPYTGVTGVTNAHATPNTVAPSPTSGTANTVQIDADHFPSTAALHFSIRGAALGCSINARTGVLTIGRQAGTVTVRAANVSGGPNWDETTVTIANPTPPPPVPSPTPGTPGTPPGSGSPTPGSSPPVSGDSPNNS